ncbi:C25 family cysteine peptidase [Pontiella sp.]|uniref:C25 family cysteine peptidase n=1 Tax=Pontiella sp. TaxID=2837462 RepID=UPI00356A74A6
MNFCRAAWAVVSLLGLASLSWAGTSGTPGLLFAPGTEVLGFKAASDGAVTSVRWETGLEMGVHAYRVVGEDLDGTTQTIGLVRAQLDEQNEYWLTDPNAQVGDSVSYRLDMISSHGESQLASWAGTIEVEEEAPAPVRMAATVTAQTTLSVSERKCWIGNVDRVKAWTNAVPADRIRFSLTEEGIYKVTAQEIADAGGWDFETVTNALATTNFAMSCQGEDVAWHPLDDGLIFYGVESESRWAPENVYWIEFGPGLNMASIDGTPPVNGTTNQWFMDELAVRGTDDSRYVMYCTLADSPPSFLAHSYLLSGDDDQAAQELIGCAPGDWTGTVSVNLHSLYYGETDSADCHTGRVSVGTASVGVSTWTNEQYVSGTYPFSSTNLTNGSVTLRVENIAADPGYPVDYTRFFWMSYGLSYARLYQAEGGTLQCSGGAGDVVSVSGFATNDLIVLDVSTTNMPEVIAAADRVYDGSSSNWSAAFACGDTSAVYQVCSKSEGLRLPSVRGVHDVDWTAASCAVDYAILIPPEGWMDGFRSPLQELADFRNAQGLLTAVIDVESLYNRFSHGLVDPGAVETFCQAGVSNWTDRPLQYLLLAADGSPDFKHDRYTIGDDRGWFIPTRLDSQRFSGGEGNITALDASMGDVDGDGIPEVAIGRLPTGLGEEVATVVQKTMDYEAALLRSNGSLAKAYAAVAPDYNQTPGTSAYYGFDLGCDRLIAPLEDAGRVHVACRAPTNDTTNLTYVRNSILFPALQEGCGIFHFFGHSSKYLLGYSYSRYILQRSEIGSANWSSPTIAITLGCNPNVWHWLYPNRALVPYGLFAENAGFVAALGATGFLLGDESEELAVNFYTAAAKEGQLRLGDVYLAGLREAFENPLNPNRLSLPERNGFAGRMQCLSLIGDPALVMRHDITSSGTDVEWLVGYGQTNANADWADVDSDGWATWREFQADTNPTGNVLQVIGAGVDAASGLPLLSFETASTKTYRIEYKPSLSSSNDWQAVSWSVDGSAWNPAETEVVPAGPVETVMVSESTIATQGFFRVRTGE